MTQHRERICFILLRSLHLTVSSESDLKDECVVLYKVLYGAASSEVLPVALEQCGTENDGQIMDVHLVQLGKTLHAKKHAGKIHMGIYAPTHAQR